MIDGVLSFCNTEDCRGCSHAMRKLENIRASLLVHLKAKTIPVISMHSHL
jgi:hypothetical protein